MDNTSTPPAQEKVAKSVTTIVLTGTCVFGVLGIVLAIAAMNGKAENIDKAKDILQILFSAILPLFGTWIGTILAYYFSKENLAAANATVQHLVNSITSDKKLETIKAKDIMIPIDKLVYIDYKTGTDDTTINLKTDFLDFVKTKGIQRVILLDENKIAKYVLHRSTIQEFLTEQSFANPATPTTGLTFADLKTSGNASIKAIITDGVKFIKEDANLSDAKVLMKNFTACNDVFITKTGSPNEPVLGWITDKTIAENSIV
ncbi:MAG: hypothetical protein ABJB05_02970 [Parafilimonas sp.]